MDLKAIGVNTKNWVSWDWECVIEPLGFINHLVSYVVSACKLDEKFG